MKKISYILAIALATGVTSCNSFLEEKNLGGITDKTFYVDAVGYEALVNSCYSSLRNIYDVNPSLFEYGTDVTTRGEIESVSGTVGDLVTRATALNEYKTLASNNSAIDYFFSNVYIGIQRCNTAINRANGIADLTESIRTKRIAEVRFIRAYYYYLLVENFGNMPIVKDEINAPVTHFEPNTEKEVYDFIMEDLTTALPDVDVAPIDFGRANQNAVKHLLSLVHLTRGYKTFGDNSDFQTASALAEEVINSGTHALLPSFADVFSPANQKNKEIIFSVQYDAASLKPTAARKVGNGQNVLFGWRIWRERGFFEGETGQYNRRVSDFMPTQFLYTLYNTVKDARYDGTFLSRFYAVKDETTAPIIKKGDLRFFFPYPDQTFTSVDSINLVTANPVVEIVRFPKWKQDFQGIGGALKFPMINKFFDPLATIQNNTEQGYASTRDVFIFRLAETYLIAAEAYVKLGQLDNAAQKINIVRKRATKAGQNMDIAAVDVTLDFILDERARELAGEYKRWLDLKRTKKLDRAFTNNVLTKMANASDAGILDKYYLRPIPQTVIDRDSKGYPQNPGYL